MKYKKVFICIALILVSVLGVELFSNRHVLLLNQTEKETTVLTPSSSKNCSIHNNVYITKEKGSSITWKLKNKYIDKFEFDYSDGGLLDSTITIGYVNGFGKVEQETIKDLNSVLLNKNVININKKVNYIKVHINSPGVKVKKAKVINNFNFSFSRMFITFSVIFILEMLFVFKNFFFKHLENAFALIALLMGLSMLLCVPNIKIGWDEESHFCRSYSLAILNSTENLSDEIDGFFSTETFYNYPLAQPSSANENNEMGKILNDSYDHGHKTKLRVGSTCGVSTPGYIFEALGIKLAKILGLSFTGIVFSGRLFSLLAYVLLVYFAIKIIPIGKEILLFISLMPTSLFIAVTFNYDVVVFGCIVLGIAMILREHLSKKEFVDEKKLILALMIMSFGCLPKAVYAPLTLLPFMISKDRYKSKNICHLVRIISILAFACLMSTFVLPALMGKAQNDTRGGAVDSVAQLKSILTHPITYVSVLLENIWNTFSSFAFGEAQYRLMGHLQPAKFQYLIPMISVFVILVSPNSYNTEDYQTITVKDRIWFIVLIGVSVALVWTSLYMAYTVPGVVNINGVQGRYYKPILPLFYIFLSSFNLHLNISERKYRIVLICLCILILAITNINILALYNL